MKDFKFSERPQVSICGKQYDTDITDVGFITALITSYANITSSYERFQEVQQELATLTSEPDSTKSEELISKIAEENKALYEQAKQFIIQTLGETAYVEIFSQRRPNSAEHLLVCGHIYKEVLEQRAEMIRLSYQNPTLAFKNEKRGVNHAVTSKKFIVQRKNTHNSN